MKYIGIDMGTKKVGIALSDDSGSMAFAHGIFPNNDQLLKKVYEVIEREDIEKVVIGESRSGTQKNQENAVMSFAKKFATALESRFKKDEKEISISWVNEYGSTGAVMALNSLLDARGDVSNKKSKTTTKKPLDDRAAALLLQRFLDSQ